MKPETLARVAKLIDVEWIRRFGSTNLGGRFVGYWSCNAGYIGSDADLESRILDALAQIGEVDMYMDKDGVVTHFRHPKGHKSNGVGENRIIALRALVDALPEGVFNVR